MNLFKLALAVVILGGCTSVVPSGKLIDQSREVGPFKSVSIASGFTANVSVGDQAVTLRADDNVMPYLETFIQGDSLVVQVKKDTVFDTPLTLDVTVVNPAIEGIDASGGSQVTAAATPVDTFQLSASGGSHVDVSGLQSTVLALDASGGSHLSPVGTAERARASASGGSHLDLDGVPFQALDIEASGGSHVNATVAVSVTGTLSGGSDVTITGPAHVSVDRSGGSEVHTGSP